MGICRSSVTPEGSDKDRKIAGAHWSVTLTKLVPTGTHREIDTFNTHIHT